MLFPVFLGVLIISEVVVVIIVEIVRMIVRLGVVGIGCTALGFGVVFDLEMLLLHEPIILSTIRIAAIRIAHVPQLQLIRPIWENYPRCPYCILQRLCMQYSHQQNHHDC